LSTLYVISLGAGVGKTAICAGLGRYLLNNGRKTGFFKPIIAGGEGLPVTGVDSDGIFMKRILSLGEPLENICPFIADHAGLVDSVKQAYDRVSADKDVVIIEGVDGGLAGLSLRVAEALDARVIIVTACSGQLPGPELFDVAKGFGGYLLGAVLNRVPGRRVADVHDEISGQSGRVGVDILGVFPEDRVLLALTVGELAEWVEGEIISSPDKSEELVESLMLGAMVVDPGPEYFARKSGKAVVVRGERPDMQLAALETSTRCLILTGGTPPVPVVLDSARVKGVPIILVKGDTITTVNSIEQAPGKGRFNQEKKLPRLTAIMEEHFNFRALDKGLGLVT